MSQQFFQFEPGFSIRALPYDFHFPTLFLDNDYNSRTQKRYYSNWDVTTNGCPVAIPDGIPLSDYGDGLGLVYVRLYFQQ